MDKNEEINDPMINPDYGEQPCIADARGGDTGLNSSELYRGHIRKTFDWSAYGNQIAAVKGRVGDARRAAPLIPREILLWFVCLIREYAYP